MAFNRLKNEKRKMQLISLMDMVFILLLFFLVTMVVAQLSKAEQKLYIPTPKNNERGRTQILIQLLEGKSILWLDRNSTPIVEKVMHEQSYKLPNELRQEILNTLLQQCVIAEYELKAKLSQLVSNANLKPNHQYFVLIRCPDIEPYSRTVKIISALAKAKYKNIKYGCVGGSINQIRNCQNITTVNESGHLNLWIDF
ncbi:biopolymer transporter ExbD [candidate division KSB1 bacterium]|nr:biopolymer transporter ExbD [candidate division KSB1 bacterium]MBL7094744.1 biopolymer transporter ExbD [candidate division KSB1 bacterium]